MRGRRLLQFRPAVDVETQELQTKTAIPGFTFGSLVVFQIDLQCPLMQVLSPTFG
jgi:hypothetical protein